MVNTSPAVTLAGFILVFCVIFQLVFINSFLFRLILLISCVVEYIISKCIMVKDCYAINGIFKYRFWRTEMNRLIVKTGLKLLLILLISVAMGAALMTSVYCIPTARIESHVGNSAGLFEKEGSYPSFSLGYSNSIRDNFTDAFMLLEASYNDGNSGPITASMANYRYGIEGLDPVQSLVMHYKNGKDFDEEVLYGRYWNGYLVFLKPLLFLFDYSTIRCINIGFQIVLFLILLCLFYQKGLKLYILPYIISILMSMPFAIALNLQLTNCYTIFNVGILVVLLLKDDIEKKACYVFLCLGIATAFIDLLSYPLVTFGIPAVIYYCVTKHKNVKSSLFDMIKIGLSWCLGYGGMWISKWIFGSIISGENLFLDGINQFLFRVGSLAEKTGSTISFSVFDTINKNIQAFWLTPATFLFEVFVIVMLALVLKNVINNRRKLSESLMISIPYVLLMVAPFLWYIFVRNHSAIHADFLANKELLITAMSGAFLLIKLYLWSKKPTAKELS